MAQSQLSGQPYTVGEWLLIIRKTSGIDMKVLCRERSPAMATIAGSGAVPALIAAMILRCAGQMRIQTFAAMIVPRSAPTWMNIARPEKIVDSHQAAAASRRSDTIAPAIGCLPRGLFQSAS